MNKQIEFSPEAKQAIHLLETTKKNLFITGKAGTGKSTLLEYIRKTPHQEIIVLAPTGIAAINVNGETIHSFFKLKPGYELKEAANMRIDPNKSKQYQTINTILIDEISMVRADILDAIDIFLKRVRDNNTPFGGVRMIFFGDLFQLPPVVPKQDSEPFFKEYKSPYFFSAQVFIPKDLFSEPFSMETIELTTIYRQKDKNFIRILNAIRDNSISWEDLAFLNKNVKTNLLPEKEKSYIHLMATNAQALSMNMAKLQEINTQPREFKAFKKGKIGNLQPNDPLVTLKIGAQVMFINNDSKKRWVNGTIGKITDIIREYDEEIDDYREGVLVTLENGHSVKTFPHTWEISKYVFKKEKFVREQMGTYTQIPLKLAWAITIHKSQGKTFNHIAIDLGRGGFAHGQTYVALSRCTSPEGLILKQPIHKSDIIVDPVISAFMKNKS